MCLLHIIGTNIEKIFQQLETNLHITSDNRDPGTYNFTKDWSLFWVDRIQVYYSKRLQNVIDKIGAKYKVTLCDATFRENDSQMKTDKTSEATIEIGICITINIIYNKNEMIFFLKTRI